MKAKSDKVALQVVDDSELLIKLLNELSKVKVSPNEAGLNAISIVDKNGNRVYL